MLYGFIMHILFLDTETTALSPNSGQVIEVGGVLTTFDTSTHAINMVSSFESLVALRQTMDERITRLTGITSQELATAKPLHKVQEDWYNWLKAVPLNTLVVGHSLSFDLGFLRSENWFLPENLVECDTLDLAKILLPGISAVNLEFLLDTLELAPTKNQLATLNTSKQAKLAPHRALFDTVVTVNLLSNLIQKLVNFPYSPEFTSLVCKYFLHLPVVTYEKPLSWDTVIQKEEKQPVITFDGKIIEKGFFERLNTKPTKAYHDSLLSLCKESLPHKYIHILLGLISTVVEKVVNPRQNLKLHGKNQAEFLFAQEVMDLLQSESESRISHNVKSPRLKQFESIITQVKSISEHTYEVSRIITLCEIYISLSEKLSTHTAGLEPLKKIITCFDFLLFAVQPHIVKSEFVYDPQNLKPEEEIVRRKVAELSSLLEDFDTDILHSNHPLLSHIGNTISTELSSWHAPSEYPAFDPTQKLVFRLYNDQLTVSTAIQYFNLNTYISSLFTAHPDMTVETFFDEDTFVQFLTLTNLLMVFQKHQPIMKYRYNENTQLLAPENTEKLPDFLNEKTNLAKAKNGFVLLLCGQNSSLKDIERAATKNLAKEDYFVLGESGSLTKVISKLIKNTRGIAAIKLGDFYYLKRYLDRIQFAEIWIVNQPYFAIHRYWYMLASRSSNKDAYLKKLKQFYLKAQSQYIQSKSEKDVYFMRNY
jgi:DNA polymerase III epsilon subunit-like protein